jgi:hypothetical protein
LLETFEGLGLPDFDVFLKLARSAARTFDIVEGWHAGFLEG